jgi:hypothetical protein
MAEQLYNSGKIFSVLNQETDIIENQKDIVTFPMFTNESPTVTAVYTSSYMSSTQKQYYLDIATTSNTLDSDFSIAYGHIHGSGSVIGATYTYPSKAIYYQYKQLLLEPGETLFKFSDGTTSDSIYVINFKRERYKQRIDPGNWQLTLTMLNGASFFNRFYTGSNIQIAPSRTMGFSNSEGITYPTHENTRYTFIDDSNESIDTVASLLTPKRVYNVIYKPGSKQTGSPFIDITPLTDSFGLFYPDYGVIILDAKKLDTYLYFNTVTQPNINGDNPYKLYKSISGSVNIVKGFDSFSLTEQVDMLPVTGLEARGTELVTSTYYYCRVQNTDFNFSTNPSFTTGSLGDLRQKTMVGDPKVFITTVGLYNKNQELVAVAKLSKPILKTFYTEAIIKVKLDW